MAASAPAPLSTADLDAGDSRLNRIDLVRSHMAARLTLPGTVLSDLALDWGFPLADGSCFTDPQWTRWREAAKRFLWTLRVDPPPGHRRARYSSLVRAFQHLRVLIRWMAGKGYRRFADLDRDAAGRFLATVKARPGRKGQTLSGRHWPAMPGVRPEGNV